MYTPSVRFNTSRFQGGSMAEETPIRPEITAAVSKHIDNIVSLEAWQDGGAKLTVSSGVSYNFVKEINEMGHVCGGITTRDNVLIIYIETDEL